MDKNEYEKKSKELQDLSKHIPLNWGQIQNNTTDKILNLFEVSNKIELESRIKNFTEQNKNYYRRRWFLWQCAKVDEYLFYKENNIRKNPNAKDKDWDIEFYKNPELQFDIKGTIVPKSLRKNFTFSDEEKIINFYYKNQSKGVRNHIQNRLFIVHHSYYKEERSLFLRCHWKLKEKAYHHFNQLLMIKNNCISYKNVMAKCIFIIENKNNEFSYYIN